ncbi:ribosomal subunit interface protein [Halobacteroides halobius DSM 5150]|uniref:Ribosome hibernation promoting factor n=1 Tax=Halobacteroides halobius (strain ATCC 35273 / DSM 5150 / MD-1) TaxID=748449 RepID=L0K9W4_HALHC|nr:ribosome-associated translation inhibitor RaiA [Halobacteroides halobius]AGB42107.1 ribosomal subunit interface protein [Halobacteroides halobius DSM 5150]
MKFMLRGKNIEITDALRNYVEEKVGKVENYFDDEETEIEAQISLDVEKEGHIVEVTVFVDGLILRAEKKTGDMYASIDGVIEKLERQIRKYKTRVQRKIKKEQENFRKNVIESREEDNDDDDPNIVRTKRFAVKPMDVKEAVMQMDLLDHDFFVFSNAETKEVNVVYKRKNGDYGLIEPSL